WGGRAGGGASLAGRGGGGGGRVGRGPGGQGGGPPPLPLPTPPVLAGRPGSAGTGADRPSVVVDGGGARRRQRAADRAAVGRPASVAGRRDGSWRGARGARHAGRRRSRLRPDRGVHPGGATGAARPRRCPATGDSG